jgi:hypothetical protein
MLSEVDGLSQAIDQVQTALDGGDASQIAPAVRQYTKIVSDTSALFDQRRDNMLGLV